jgi:hypothetical protein
MQVDLSEMMRLMLADVKPLAKITRRSPEPALINRHQPGIVALSEF